MSIILLDTNVQLCKEWTQLLALMAPFLHNYDVSIHHGPLDTLNVPIATSTIVVSPGNSLAFFGGGIDLSICKLYSNDPNNHKQTEHFIQTQLLASYSGYISPTIANIVDFKNSNSESIAWLRWKSNKLLHLPTIRCPDITVSDDLAHRRHIYDCTWNLLNKIQQYNEKKREIDTIVIPGLGTGYGGVSVEIAAKSMIMAIMIHQMDLSSIQKSYLTLLFLKHDISTFGESSLEDQIWSLDEQFLELIRKAFN